MNLRKLLISLVIVFLAAAIGSLFTSNSISGWYSTLVKPSFSPPNWVFGPVWTTLYILIAISLYLVWNKNKLKSVALYSFSLQLLLNVFWSTIFFGLHSPVYAFICIILLWLSVIWNMLEFYKISKISAYLLVPYLLWVSFATILNYYVVVLN